VAYVSFNILNSTQSSCCWFCRVTYAPGIHADDHLQSAVVNGNVQSYSWLLHSAAMLSITIRITSPSSRKYFPPHTCHRYSNPGTKLPVRFAQRPVWAEDVLYSYYSCSWILLFIFLSIIICLLVCYKSSFHICLPNCQVFSE